MAAVGIDFGTIYSRVGVWQSNSFEMIPNVTGKRETFSCVSFSEEILVGNAARKQSSRNTENTIFDIKRIIGRKFNDPVIQTNIDVWDFKLIEESQNRPAIQVNYKNETKLYFAEDITSIILSHLRKSAEIWIGTPVTNAVITAPTCFTSAQRKATKYAAEMSGLNVLSIINAPTAAGIAYMFEQKQMGNGRYFDTDRNVLIVDFGGGTFDVSLMTMNHENITVKSTFGDTNVGGRDFDTILVKHFATEFRRKNKLCCSHNKRAMRRLRIQCENAKRTLSICTRAVIEIESLYDGIDFVTSICRARPEDLYMQCIRQRIDLNDVMNELLKESKIKKCDVDEIILVGGSTKIPKIQQVIKQIFDWKELYKWHCWEPVVKGATIYAHMLFSDVSKQIVNGYVKRYGKCVPVDIKNICLQYYYNCDKLDMIGDLSLFEITNCQ
eukprot:202795_1